MSANGPEPATASTDPDPIVALIPEAGRRFMTEIPWPPGRMGETAEQRFVDWHSSSGPFPMTQLRVVGRALTVTDPFVRTVQRGAARPEPGSGVWAAVCGLRASTPTFMGFPTYRDGPVGRRRGSRILLTRWTMVRG